MMMMMIRAGYGRAALLAVDNRRPIDLFLLLRTMPTLLIRDVVIRTTTAKMSRVVIHLMLPHACKNREQQSSHRTVCVVIQHSSS